MDAAEASIETKETPPVTQPNINAVECFECGHIEEDPEYESAHPGDTPPECQNCEDENTQWVLVEPCNKGMDCLSNDHHFGIDKHVREV